jgi:hypothetical protein
MNGDNHDSRQRLLLQLFQLLTCVIARKKLKHRHYVKRGDLINPKESAWIALDRAKRDDAFISAMGLDVASFDHLAQRVEEELLQRKVQQIQLKQQEQQQVEEQEAKEEEQERKYNDPGENVEFYRRAGVVREAGNRRRQRLRVDPIGYIKSRGGRPPSLDTRGKLALLLYYLHGTGYERELCQTFGIVEHTCSATLSMMLPLLLTILEKDPDARIAWPTAQECEGFANQIADSYSCLRDKQIFGFLDGVWYKNQNHADKAIQNAYYNGWKGTSSVTNVLAFTPDGCICWANINCPGSWHDSRVVLPLHRLLQDHTPPGYKLVADSGFQGHAARIITTRKAGQYSQDFMIALQQRVENHRISSLRQAAEWGMRAVEAFCPRLNRILAATNVEYNRVLLSVCFRLFNYRTRRMSNVNQIKTVFSADYIRPLL